FLIHRLILAENLASRHRAAACQCLFSMALAVFVRPQSLPPERACVLSKYVFGGNVRKPSIWARWSPVEGRKGPYLDGFLTFPHQARFGRPITSSRRASLRS